MLFQSVSLEEHQLKSPQKTLVTLKTNLNLLNSLEGWQARTQYLSCGNIWTIQKENQGSITSRRENELVTWMMLREIITDVDSRIYALKNKDPLHHLDQALLLDL